MKTQAPLKIAEAKIAKERSFDIPTGRIAAYHEGLRFDVRVYPDKEQHVSIHDATDHLVSLLRAAGATGEVEVKRITWTAF